MAAIIASHDDIENWLLQEPNAWGKIIAVRSALRAFPIATARGIWLQADDQATLIVQMLRALVISYAGCVIDDLGEVLKVSASLASEGVMIAATKSKKDMADEIDGSVFSSAVSASEAANSQSASDANETISALCALAVSRSEDANVRDGLFWRWVSFDCNYLLVGKWPRSVLSSELWNQPPTYRPQRWKSARRWLSATGRDFAIWREWYHGRVEGLSHAFADFDAETDEKFYRWIVEQSDDWWSRQPAEVNAEITEFVNSLRKPKTPPPDETQLTQNPSVGTYIIDEDGRSVLAPEPLPNGLSDDPDTRDAFDEIRRLAEDGVSASDPLRTQAPEFGGPAALLADACGERLEDVSPVKFVVRGKALVRKVEGRIDGSLMGPPLSEEQEEALAPLAEAIKLAVRTEPKLFELWQGDFEVAKPVLTTQQINIAIAIAGEAGQTVEEADTDLKDAASVIPEDADEENAERKTASEKVTNFFRSLVKPFKWVDGIVTFTDKALKIGERLAKHWPKLAETFQNNSLIRWIIDLFLS